MLEMEDTGAGTSKRPLRPSDNLLFCSIFKHHRHVVIFVGVVCFFGVLSPRPLSRCTSCFDTGRPALMESHE